MLLPQHATKPGVLRVKSLENIGWTVPSPLPAMSSTRPSSRTGRKLRFAEVGPRMTCTCTNQHPYLLNEPSSHFHPHQIRRMIQSFLWARSTRTLDAISSERADSTNGATEYQPTRAAKADDEPGEGTPEYIRRRYFPNVPANDPGLAWMEASSLGTTDPSVPRFDLQGVPIPIPTSLSASLPSHLGLHHHAEGSHAGYTIDDIFLLARSTVPAQRASMLGILAKVAHRLGRQVQHTDSPDEVVVFPGQEGQLRNRILAAGLAAIDQIGSLGARAVEVVWQCTVEWDGMTSELESVELSVAPDTVSSLQLDYLLPQSTDVLSHDALPPESLARLLAVLHWLAQQSNQSSDMTISTPRLVRMILDIFLLTPIPPKEESVLPNPLALQMLITLASASRSNASALLDPADALLRFVTPLPPSSPYPPALATTLLTNTLRFYSTLASYGLYSQIVTTAPQIFTDLASYISSIPSIHEGENASDSASTRLRIAWASLIEAWTVCAMDPMQRVHRTR
ncbi:RPAP1-like protein [Boletus edulis]|uniref:RPAP1-like protein n=1 Tax=Boletus edulis BED1 TaxID=1328754 RepID=A0AAD4BF18_BOLED|nr:RPAP1-like protein [Boletus edulis]KAF8425067.1 RPAP1-like protein [Boletus edulis BED1]